MNDYLQAVALALLPAAGNFFGGVLAELLPTSKAVLNNALHAAAGVVLAVVAVELMPEALAGAAPAWALALAFFLGGCFYLGIETMLQRVKGAEGRAGGTAAHWMIFAAVSMDLFSDGLMLGTGSVVSFSLAVVLALGQVLADIPEGFATVAMFKSRGVPRAKRLVFSACFVAPVMLGATLGYWLLRGQSEALQLAALVFTAGLLAVAVTEEMVAQAHESIADTRYSVLAFSGGFSLFVVVSSYFG